MRKREMTNIGPSRIPIRCIPSSVRHPTHVRYVGVSISIVNDSLPVNDVDVVKTLAASQGPALADEALRTARQS
jgi:hypothetical protein